MGRGRSYSRLTKWGHGDLRSVSPLSEQLEQRSPTDESLISSQVSVYRSKVARLESGLAGGGTGLHPGVGIRQR